LKQTKQEKQTREFCAAKYLKKVCFELTSSPSSQSTVIACTTLLLSYGAIHCLYYGVLFSPLFADLDHSLVDIIISTLQNSYYAPPSRESFELTLKFMKHFGLNR
jgi:hypothetical protein